MRCNKTAEFFDRNKKMSRISSTGAGAPVLTPADLFEEQKRRDKIRLETYNKLLTVIHNKIREAASNPVATGAQMVQYDVMDWQPGCPSFDAKDCILYLVWQLRASGFQVIYVPKNRLLIGWAEQTAEYYKKESPIRQAMMASIGGGGGASDVSGDKAPPKKKPTAYRAPPTGTGTSNSAKSITFI